MATNSERQQAYRQRHLRDETGTGSRLNLVIEQQGHLALKRLARHHGVTLSAMLSRLAAAEQQRVLAELSSDAQAGYFDAVTA